jgi:hypothetical protein
MFNNPFGVTQLTAPSLPLLDINDFGNVLKPQRANKGIPIGSFRVTNSGQPTPQPQEAGQRQYNPDLSGIRSPGLEYGIFGLPIPGQDEEPIPGAIMTDIDYQAKIETAVEEYYNYGTMNGKPVNIGLPPYEVLVGLGVIAIGLFIAYALGDPSFIYQGARMAGLA